MTETTALATRSTYLAPPDRNEWASMIEMANTLAKAQGFVPQHFYGQPYKILAAVLFGRDLGISATNALQHIIVIDGKATADAQLIGMLVRRAGHSIEDSTTLESSTVTITRGDDKTKHEVTFSMEDARRAGLLRPGSAWSKYPSAMLYARALTACARKGAQDALMGTIYTPEEIGAQVNEEGNVTLPPDRNGEIPALEASPASQAALAEERERHERQQAETDAYRAEVSNDPRIADPDEILPPRIAGNSSAPRTANPVAQPVQSATATEPVKRRGRPLGSKNAPKAEGGVAVEPRSPAAASQVGTRPEPPAAFGDDPESFAEPGDALEPKRNEIRRLANRLRKYQYMEQGRDLPATPLWQQEVERTLGIFVERKFGTNVALEDVEEAGLREAIGDLKGYLEKYEDASESDIASDDQHAEAAGVADTTVVSLHKPIVRNPVPATKRDPNGIDPKAALDRARLVADLRNRTTALLATKEGLINLSAKDEERLRLAAETTMDRAAQGSFQKPIKELDNGQLETLVARAKAAGNAR